MKTGLRYRLEHWARVDPYPSPPRTVDSAGPSVTSLPPGQVTKRPLLALGIVVYYVVAIGLSFQCWRATLVLNDTGPLSVGPGSAVVPPCPVAVGQRVELTGSLVNRSRLPVVVRQLDLFPVADQAGPAPVQAAASWLEVRGLALNLSDGEAAPGLNLGGGRVGGLSAVPFTATVEITGQPPDSRSAVLLAARVRYSWLGLSLAAESTDIWMVALAGDP